MRKRTSPLSTLFQEFLRNEQASGLLLLLAAAAALLVANSPMAAATRSFLNTEVGLNVFGLGLRHSLLDWINEGLMTLFFVLIGLEIEREVYVGELSSPHNALLPALAALGGMLVPASIHFYLNHSLPTHVGFGIPMATDIAFALGALKLLGTKVPPSLKIFLTALAIIDDLGAMLVIGFAYSGGIQWLAFVAALLVFCLMLVFNRKGVVSLWVYVPLGVFMWALLLNSGVQTSIAGIMFAFALPFRGKGNQPSPSAIAEHTLNIPVGFLIMPLFAFANSGVVINASFISQFLNANTLGIMLGLLIGKPLGIIGLTFGAVKAKVATLPNGLGWRHIIGAGFLGGIGFTMSTFITVLAFGNSLTADMSKVAIVLGSLLAGLVGMLILSRALRPRA